MTFTAAQLQTLIRSARKKAKEDIRFLGVRGESAGEAPTDLEVDGDLWRVVAVRSPLQARKAIVDAGDSGRALLVTPLTESELGLEVVARFGLRRLESLQPWQIVRELFQAQRLDPRVVRESWMAEVLLAHEPADGYPPAPSGLLDLDAAWKALLPQLGIGNARPGALDLLQASAAGGFQARWNGANQALRTGAKKRFAMTAGVVGEYVAAVLERGHGDDLVPLGLLLDLLAASELVGDPRAVAARTRLEAFGIHVDELAEIEAWSSQAVRWCKTASEKGGFDGLTSTLDRADAIAEQVGAGELTSASSILRSGLRARLKQFGAALGAILLSPHNQSARESLEACFGRFEEHLLTTADPALHTRSERVRHALRLARWLGTAEAKAGSLAESAEQYREDGAYADRSRYVIIIGEADGDLAGVYEKLADAVRERRERENRAFATHLAAACSGQEGSGVFLPIERVLDDVVAPLAREAKVLLVVMDGMSTPIFHQLAEDLERRTMLQRMAPADLPGWPPTLGLLPTTTEVCRASLLCGKRTVGHQAEEQEGLEEVAARHGWRGATTRKPILFHKGDLLGSGGGLSAELRDSLQSTLSVVSVVVNVVDDQLPKGDQVRPDWSLATVPVLEALISQAEIERRAVVLTADHGHIVEIGTTEKAVSEHTAERWRTGEPEAGEGEIEVRGERVLQPCAGGPVILPWSEKIRYSKKHAGYHGGGTAQEVVTPMAVFVPANEAEKLTGWGAEVVVRPHWWEGTEPVVVVPVVQPAPPVRTQRKKPQETLFPEIAAVEPINAEGTWIDELLDSPTYVTQRKLVGRTPPAEEDIRNLLGALESAGGTLTITALRNQTRIALPRLRGLLTAANRILNVDGYPVLDVDLTSSTVRVEFELLYAQFQIERRS